MRFMTISFCARAKWLLSQPADLHRLQYEKASVVRGHHIYKSLWTPEVNEILLLWRETGNEHDEYAVAVLQQLLRLTILFARSFHCCQLEGECVAVPRHTNMQLPHPFS